MAHCENNYSNCGVWARNGYCDIYLYMLEDCMKSCNVCATTTTTKTTTSKTTTSISILGLLAVVVVLLIGE